MIAKDLNKTAQDSYEVLEQHKYFDEIKRIEQEIYDNKNAFNKVFYWHCQDKLNQINGEFRTTYGELKALMETYTAVRKVELMQNKKVMIVNGTVINLSREPGNELLTEFARSEITNLVSKTIVLYSWLMRIEGSIITCRNHSYGSNS